MSRPIRQFAAPFLLAVLAASGLAQQPAAAHSDAPAPLFDGKSIKDWVKRGGAAEYRVENGEIVGATRPDTPNTFLCTPRDYADFILEYEFKVDPRLNSGVQIRSHSVPGYQDGVVHGYQVEIDPSERAFTCGIYDEARRGWLVDLKDNEAARKAFQSGEWNQVRVEARGPSIKTWLNGVAAADLHDELTRSGFIGLQVHSTDAATPLEVRWRNLTILDLGDPWQAPPEDGQWLLRGAETIDLWEPDGKPGSRIGWAMQTNGAVHQADGTVMQAYLEVVPKSGNIVTRQALGDCRLHVEFMVDDNGQTGQANGNSGVYLQGRYEVQVLNSAGQAPAKDNCGAIYGVKAPDFNMARPAGQWQTFDIWFHQPRWDSAGKKTANARMTVYHNGTRIHDDVEVPNTTGGGRGESPEPGALLLQDHGNRIRYRNIWVAPRVPVARLPE